MKKDFKVNFQFQGRRIEIEGYGPDIIDLVKFAGDSPKLRWPTLPIEEEKDSIIDQVEHIYSDCTNPEIRKKAFGEMETFLLDLHKRIHDEAFEKYSSPRIGTDNICPITKLQCDDECCTPGSICNVSGEISRFSPIKVPDTNVGDIPQSVGNEPIKKISEQDISEILITPELLKERGWGKSQLNYYDFGPCRIWPHVRKQYWEGVRQDLHGIQELTSLSDLITFEGEDSQPAREVSEPAKGDFGKNWRLAYEECIRLEKQLTEEIAVLKEELEAKNKVDWGWFLKYEKLEAEFVGIKGQLEQSQKAEKYWKDLCDKYLFENQKLNQQIKEEKDECYAQQLLKEQGAREIKELEAQISNLEYHNKSRGEMIGDLQDELKGAQEQLQQSESALKKQRDKTLEWICRHEQEEYQKNKLKGELAELKIQLSK